MESNSARPPMDQPEDLFRPRPLKDAVHEFKDEFILGVLKTTGGVQKTAAEILGIQPTYLSRLLSQMRTPHTGRLARHEDRIPHPAIAQGEGHGAREPHLR